MAEERMLNDEILLGLIKANSGGGGGGTTDYEDLDNKPQIGGVTLSGNKSLSDLGVQEKLTAGMYININSGTISVKRDVSEDVDEVLTLTHDTSGGTNKINAVLTVGGETIDSDTFTTAGGTFHDMVQISFNTRAVRFMFKYLVASKTQSAGYENYIYNEYTDTFVETIGEESKLIIKSEMDSALSDKQDTLTFDSVPTNGSTNPVESNGVYDALATKQDATDNSLETEAKTIVGAINENAGDIGSLKSGLTNLDNEVNGDAVEYPYADVITIPDAVPANLADCSVKIEPDQNLHGFDHPWVGGAGKNKLPLVLADIKTANTDGTWNDNVYTVNNGTFTVNTDSDGNVVSIKANGTFNANSFIIIEKGNLQKYNGMILNGCPSGGSGSTYNIKVQKATGDYAIYATDTGNGYTLPDSITSDNAIVYISINSGYNAQNLMFYPMLRLSTETDATFAPYTNICPISGHTEASVQRDGVNIWDEEWEVGGIDDTDGSKTSASNQIRSKNYIPCMANTDYYVSAPASTISTYIYYYASDYSFIGRAGQAGAYNVSEQIITTPANCAYMMMKAGALTSYGNNISINYPSSITPYEPFKGKTYTIALGDTIYGGTVDFDSGVMTVTHGIVDLGSLSWTKYQTVYYAEVSDSVVGTEGELPNIKCSCYKTVTTVTGQTQMLNKDDASITNNASYDRLYVKDTTNYADATEFETAMDGMTATYELVTPFTIQLTPTQIQLLKGQNTLTASTGQISVTVNGVSGAIGAVQEQVNDIAEDVAELQGSIFENWTEVASGYPTDRPFLMAVMHTVPNSGVYDSKLFLTNPLGRTVYFNLGSETGKSYLNGQGAYTTNEIPQDYVIKVYAKA